MLPMDVLKTLHPFEYFCVRTLFAYVCDRVSGRRVLICLYASATLYALFRYLGFPVWSLMTLWCLSSHACPALTHRRAANR